MLFAIYCKNASIGNCSSTAIEARHIFSSITINVSMMIQISNFLRGQAFRTGKSLLNSSGSSPVHKIGHSLYFIFGCHLSNCRTRLTETRHIGNHPISRGELFFCLLIKSANIFGLFGQTSRCPYGVCEGFSNMLIHIMVHVLRAGCHNRCLAVVWLAIDNRRYCNGLGRFVDLVDELILFTTSFSRKIISNFTLFYNI